MPSLTFSFDLSNGGGLADLNTFLSGRSYIVAFTPSQTDVAVYEALKGTNYAKFANLERFFNHIASFTDAQRAKFPAGVRGLSTDAPAPAGGGGGAGKGGKGKNKGGKAKTAAAPAPKAAAAPKAPAKKAAAADDDSDDDLFGSDSDDDDFGGAAAAAAAAKKKADEAKAKKKKAEPVGRTQVMIEVKPLDDETDLGEIEAKIRTITKEGLKWGEEFRRVDVAYGIQKLVVTCVIIDDLVMLDDFMEPIEAMEDLVQSVDLCTMNRL